MPLMAVAQAGRQRVGAILQIEQPEQLERLAANRRFFVRDDRRRAQQRCRSVAAAPATGPASRTLSSTFRSGNRRMF